MAIDYEALLAEIQATPECAPHIVPSTPKALPGVAAAGDKAIADILNVGRVTVQSKMVSSRGFTAAYPGTPFEAEAVLMKLEGARDALLASADPAEKVIGSMLRRQLGFMNSDGLDFGDADLRAMITQFGALGIVTPTEAANMLKIGEAPEVLTAADISRAVRGPRS